MAVAPGVSSLLGRCHSDTIMMRLYACRADVMSLAVEDITVNGDRVEAVLRWRLTYSLAFRTLSRLVQTVSHCRSGREKVVGGV